MKGILAHRSGLASLRSFHQDEEGMEALQTVGILAIAALVMVGLFFVYNRMDNGLGNEDKGVYGAIKTLASDLFTGITELFSAVKG